MECLQGLGNMVGSFFSCMPITASLSRSLIQQTVGGHTQLASLISCGILISVLLWIGPFFQPLPRVIISFIVQSTFGFCSTQCSCSCYKLKQKEMNQFHVLVNCKQSSCMQWYSIIYIVVCSSEHNRSGAKRDVDEGHRFYEILETRQNRRRHLGPHFYNRDTLRRWIWIVRRHASLHWKITRARCATLYMQACSCTRYGALFGC